MALENTVETLEGIDEKFHSLYTEVEGKYELDEHLRTPDTTALLNAKKAEKEARKKAEERATALAAEKEQWEIKKAELEGDKEKADKLRQQALDKQKAQHQNENKILKERIHNLTVGKEIDYIASQVYVKPEAMNLDFLKERVKLDEGDKVTIVDALGASMTAKELIEELKGDESMAMFIKGGRASGGGAGGGSGDEEEGKGVPDSKAAAMKKKKDALKKKYPNLRN